MFCESEDEEKCLKRQTICIHDGRNERNLETNVFYGKIRKGKENRKKSCGRVSLPRGGSCEAFFSISFC